MPRWTTPFAKQVRSNCVLSVYDPASGELFEEEYENFAEYEVALERRRTLIPEENPARQIVERGW
jgi:hypothetical protein